MLCINFDIKWNFRSHRIKINSNFLYSYSIIMRAVCHAYCTVHTETNCSCPQISSRILLRCQVAIVICLPVSSSLTFHTCRQIRSDCFVKCSPMPFQRIAYRFQFSAIFLFHQWLFITQLVNICNGKTFYKKKASKRINS